MNRLSIKTKTEIKVGDVPLDDVLQKAIDLAHFVLEELSIYRQHNNLESDVFSCEGEACAFLDMIGD